MKIVYMVLISILIFLIIGGIVMLVGILDLYTLTNRVEGYVMNAAWAGFSEINLDTIAERNVITNEELRDAELNKSHAYEIIKEYIKENLKLNDEYYPTEESFIQLKQYPVLIEDMVIYNPSDLPNTAPNGKFLTESSIYIRLRFPLHISLAGDVYKEIEVIVDTKTFYSRIQEERM